MRPKIAETAHDWYMLTEQNSMNVGSLKQGDRISILQKDSDVEGVIIQLPRFNVGEIKLATANGIELIPVNPKTYIHLIRAAETMTDKLDLKKHNEYDRDQECFLGNTHRNDGREEFTAEIDPKTKMPKSKLSLNLKKTKTATNA